MLTLQMTSLQQGKPLSKDACLGIIERWWSTRIVNPSTVKGLSSGMGVVFDIQNNYYEKFLDNYDHIKGQEGLSLDFVVSRCQELPSIDDDNTFGGGSRDHYEGSKRGGQGGSYGGRGGHGGSE